MNCIAVGCSMKDTVAPMDDYIDITKEKGKTDHAVWHIAQSGVSSQDKNVSIPDARECSGMGSECYNAQGLLSAHRSLLLLPICSPQWDFAHIVLLCCIRKRHTANCIHI